MESIKQITIVIIGNWNTKIFTPSWMMSQLLCLEETEELKIGFNNNDLQPIYKYKNVSFIPTESSFQIKFEDISEDIIKIVNNAVLKLITTLPYTPNLLVGFNYSENKEFDVSNVNVPKFSSLFELNDIKYYKEEPNFVLNVILNCKGEHTVNYNFHYTDLSFITENAIAEHLEYLKKLWEQI